MAHPSYYVAGKKVPSVTTVLSRFKDPGALMHWSWECAYKPLEEAVYHLEEVTKTHRQISAIQKSKQFLATRPLEKGKFRKEALDAATAGTYAHGLVEQWIHGSEGERSNLERMTPRIFSSRKKCDIEIATKALRSFSAFIKWIRQSKFELSVTEDSLVSERYKFGGTLDCTGWLGDKLILLDWKTSKRIYVDYLLQVAAYTILWNENYDTPIDEAHVILFHKVTGDFQHFQFQDLKEPRFAFLRLVEVYRIVSRLEKAL